MPLVVYGNYKHAPSVEVVEVGMAYMAFSLV